jgi:hypothetical protein
MLDAKKAKEKEIESQHPAEHKAGEMKMEPR